MRRCVRFWRSGCLRPSAPGGERFVGGGNSAGAAPRVGPTQRRWAPALRYRSRLWPGWPRPSPPLLSAAAPGPPHARLPLRRRQPVGRSGPRAASRPSPRRLRRPPLSRLRVGHGRQRAGAAGEGAGRPAAEGGAGRRRDVAVEPGGGGPGAAGAAGRVDAGHRAGGGARRRPRRLGPAAGRQRRLHRAGGGGRAQGAALPQRREVCNGDGCGAVLQS